MNRPTHETVAGARYLSLRALARETGRSTAELLQLYALEAFLARLSLSPHCDRLVLKGGVLLAALNARRPTRDVDLLALRTANDLDAVRALVGEIAAMPMEDGLALTLGQAEVIREDEAYAGIRVTLRGELASARLVFHVDVNVGDPVWPAPGPVSLPRLLSDEPILLSGYPLVMVLAEKIVTALHRGTANTRWRDFADIFVLVRGHAVAGGDLQHALQEVATFRKVPLVPMAEVLAGFASLGQPRWQVWRQKQGLHVQIPIDLAEVLAMVLAFAEPAIALRVQDARWDATTAAWSPMKKGQDTPNGFEP